MTDPSKTAAIRERRDPLTGANYATLAQVGMPACRVRTLVHPMRTRLPPLHVAAAIRSMCMAACTRTRMHTRQVMEDDLVEFAYKGHQLESEARAEEIMAKLRSAPVSSTRSHRDGPACHGRLVMAY